MKKYFTAFVGASLGVILVLACQSRAREGTKEANFKIHIIAYDTKIDSLTIENFTLRNVRQLNVINEPSDLAVRVGTKVNVEIINESPISENFTINGYEVNNTLKAGETASVSFTADKPGAYLIWCQLHPKNVHLPGSFIVFE